MSTSSTEMARLFIAVRPEEPVAEELLRVRNLLRPLFHSAGLRIKWTEPETFHITLLFLGNVPAERCPEIGRKLAEGLSEASGFKTSLRGAGLFKKSGALWVGVQSSPELQNLQQCVAESLQMDGGRFHAHFTLGRIKQGYPDSTILKKLDHISVEPAVLTIQTVELVQSELLPDGAKHTVLEEIKLQ